MCHRERNGQAVIGIVAPGSRAELQAQRDREDRLAEYTEIRDCLSLFDVEKLNSVLVWPLVPTGATKSAAGPVQLISEGCLR